MLTYSNSPARFHFSLRMEWRPTRPLSPGLPAAHSLAHIMSSSSRGSKRPATRMLQPLGYAKRLSPYTNKGVCGDEVQETVESPDSLARKVEQLAEAIEKAAYIVAHTGAGISTAAGIPDFRGENGIWTRQKRGEPLPDHEKCWNNAVPTLSHMALVGLMSAGKLQAVISQNIDGLHYRSGIPRNRLSELHGNMFMEKCTSCEMEIVRSFDVGGIGFKPTGRLCPRPRCGCRLVDALLDWEDELPEPDFERAIEEAGKCKATWDGDRGGGLALCLGTSMQMQPASELPCEAGRMAIVNLQPTQKDDEAWLVMRARLDDVMHALMAKLRIPIPVYERIETLSITRQQTLRHTRHKGGEGCTTTWVFSLSVSESSMYQKVPSGFISRVTLSLTGPDRVVALESPPFVHTEKRTASQDCCEHCAICSQQKPELEQCMPVGVTVEFEPMSAVNAGAAKLPAFQPPPWSRTYRVPIYRKCEESDDVVVTLIRVDYNELYVTPKDAT